MSRSTLPKSRTEKGKGASGTPAVTHEIVPGKLIDQEWNSLIDHECADEFAVDIVEELCTSVLDKIYQNYLHKQLVPFTVTQAKDAILQIIDWQFLSRDSGEMDAQCGGGWIEDEEPEPSMTDCWAQGSVPKRIVRGATPVIEEDLEPVASPQVAPSPRMEQSPRVTQIVEQHNIASRQIDHSPTDAKNITRERKEDGDGSDPALLAENTMKEKSQVKFKPYTGRLKSAGVAKMTESLEDTEMKILQKELSKSSLSTEINPQIQNMPASCHSILKLQTGRPPGKNDVIFDDAGNIISIYRVDPERIPTHQIKTGFKIIDPAVEAAQARLKAMRTGKYVPDKKVPRPPEGPKRSNSRHAIHTSPSHTVQTNSSKESKPFDIVPLASALIDTVSVAPGVIIKEGDQIRIGSRRKGNSSVYHVLQNDLNSVCVNATLPTLTVADLLKNQTPVVKPLSENLPIPPIAQHVE